MNREAFENWAWDWFQRNNQSRPEILNSVPREHLFFLKPDGRYHFNDMEAAWQGYQANDPAALVESLRQRLNALPRYSFLLGDPASVKKVADRTGAWVEHYDVHTLLDPTVMEAPPAKPFEFPALNDDLRAILGTMCFECIHVAQGLRADGHAIKTRAEDEQAAVLHWLLGLYFKHGAGWRRAASDGMKRMAGLMEGKKNG